MSVPTLHIVASKGSFLIKPGVGLMVWTLVVFFATLLLLKRFAFPAISKALDSRQEAIEDAIDTAERTRVGHKLQDLGYQPAPSLANFLFFHAREDASELAKRLFPYGVIVKPWREPGFTEHVRVSIGLPKHNDQFLAALAEAAQPQK